MKILQLITRDNNRSGSGVQMMQLSLELAKQGHAVTALYKLNPEMDEDFFPYQDSNVDLQRINLKDTKLKVSSLYDLLKIRSIIKNGNFDLIHSHSNAVDHAFLSTIGVDIPIISNRGMCTPLKWKNALKYKSKKISQVIAVANDVKQVMHQTGGVPNGKISVVYGSVNVDRFHPNIQSVISRSNLGIDEDAFVIGYTGSIGGRKGIDYFIDAFRDVVKTKPNTILLLVGITDQQLNDHGIIIEHEFAPNIRCLGFQHHPEHYMALFDLFVFPGTKSEGLTGAVREAAAMKIPTVTTDIGGNKELIINNESGIVVPPSDSQALTKGMLASIENYNHAKNMAQRAYQFVHENMTLQIRTKNILSIYEKFIAKRNIQDSSFLFSKPIIALASLMVVFASLLVINPSSSWINSLNNKEPVTQQGYSYKVFKNFLPGVDNLISDMEDGFYATLEEDKPNGELIHLTEFGEITVLLSGLDRPDGLRMKNNKLYILEEVKNGRFIEYDLQTTAMRTIAVLNYPEGITPFSEDSFLITEDVMGGRLVEVKLNGEVKVILRHLSRPESIIVDSVGVLYFTQTALGKVSRYANGKVTTLLDNLNEPDQLAFDESNYLWIGEDSNSSRLLRYKENKLETIAENLSKIQGILPIDNQVFIAEQGRNRILSFSTE